MEPADESLAAHVIVLQAMNNLVTHGGVQRQGCGALRKLAMEPQNRAVLMSNKHQAEVAVLTAMRSHPNHNKVQKQGCAALGAFADDNTENQATLIRLKAHEAVAAAKPRSSRAVAALSASSWPRMVRPHLPYVLNLNVVYARENEYMYIFFAGQGRAGSHHAHTRVGHSCADL